ncbi:AmpG family muropeptide MFS transporter [Comamonas serinivorans]|uniref:AmpG family muropeptide MFS transporter n=1 Tax=Comamonas serinivorans TaxID=1082851 RepID=UPI001469DCC5|nr:permease [Comamonas serinivorans]
MTSSPAAPVPPGGRWARWLAALRVYREPASLRMLALGFAAGLPLLLVLGTLSFRLREAGVDRATIGHLSWVGLAYGFKWVWAPLVDRVPLPALTAMLGRRRSWLLLSQAAIAAGLVGMALLDPRDGLQPLVLCALLVAFASATQDIALDAFRIESAPGDRQAALAACYQTGYRLAMIWSGAGVLWLAASQEVQSLANGLSERCQALISQAGAVAADVAQGAAQAAAAGASQAAQAASTQAAPSANASVGQALAGSYQNGPWEFAYLIMAVSMAVGMLTVLLMREPAPSVHADADNAAAYQGALTRLARDGAPWLGVAAFAWWVLLVGLTIAAAARLFSWDTLTPAALSAQGAGWLVPWLLSAVGLGLTVLGWRRQGPMLVPAAGSATQGLLAWMLTAFVAPFAEFITRYRWQAVLLLALVGTYRISDVVMGVMANPFYVDMCFSKAQVANVTKVYGVVMTLAGAFIGGVLSMRFGVMRVMVAGAVLSALTNLAFSWLAGFAPDITHAAPALWRLIVVVSADNLASGIASAAFVAYLSSLTNVRYSATQYALFSSMMLLAPKAIAGFSGEFVDAHGYAHFFSATALLGVPVVLLVLLAARQRSTTPENKQEYE